MAKLTGFVGDVTGKVGNMVAYVRRGVNLARQYQPNVTNPNTKRQQKSRMLFSAAYDVAAQVAPAVNMAYAAVSPTYERQNFVGKVIQSGAITVNDALTEVNVNWAEVPISWGPLVPYRGTVNPTVGEPGKITFNLSASGIADSNCLIDGVTPINCLAFAVIYCSAVEDSVMGLVGYKDKNLEYHAINGGSINIPDTFSGLKCHTWLFLKQSPTPKNGISIETLPPRIRYRSSYALYTGEVQAG